MGTPIKLDNHELFVIKNANLQVIKMIKITSSATTIFYRVRHKPMVSETLDCQFIFV